VSWINDEAIASCAMLKTWYLCDDKYVECQWQSINVPLVEEGLRLEWKNLKPPAKSSHWQPLV
jgi:hypothetical protein